MKTTLDLPDDLVRKLKIRAVREHRKLKDLAAEMLRAGLASRVSSATEQPATVSVDRKTGLPLIMCRGSASKGKELTPQRVAEILSAQEVGWSNDLG